MPSKWGTSEDAVPKVWTFAHSFAVSVVCSVEGYVLAAVTVRYNTEITKPGMLGAPGNS